MVAISLAGSIIGYDSGTAQTYYGTAVGARETVIEHDRIESRGESPPSDASQVWRLNFAVVVI